ncbi:MAG: hypothetical protein ACHQHP_01325, partial [Bacteroidia bacterium]
KKTTWSNMELWLFKVCIFSGGIAAGFYFYKYIEMYFLPFLYFFIATTIWITYLSIKKLKTQTQK